MEIESAPPHDFFLALDVDDYFEKEYDPLEIYRRGFVRPLRLDQRNVLAVIHWNERVEKPVFDVEFPRHDLTGAERREAAASVRRIVGAEIDLEPFYRAVAEDPVVGPLVERHRGFKRLSCADVYEDAIRSVIGTRISHDPTARRMVRDVREAWGEAFVHEGTTYYAYPRPEDLAGVPAESFREYGVSARKGEYLTGLAAEIAEGELDLDWLERAEPDQFYDRAREIRGIGPWTAQSLMLRRNRPDARFPSHRSGGRERGMRRWILMAHDLDPHDASEEQWEELRSKWTDFEALVSQYLYYDWVVGDSADA